MTRWFPALGVALALIACWFAYHPGLYGYFLFDDFLNLPPLGEQGPIHTTQQLLQYLTSGKADPTGRPLSVLSFLIDANDWPADPYSFKRTNVLIHMLNGALLAQSMLQIGRRSGLDERSAQVSAVIGAALWLLHPLFLSTTLYIVQREAMLPATFTLLGILCWLKGRDESISGQSRTGLAWLFGGSWVATFLAVLCKGNGILLPLLILVAEVTVLPKISSVESGARRFRSQRLWLLGLPILALAMWLAASIPSAIQGAHEFRAWSVAQRLMTEPRILMQYLWLLIAPRSTTAGLFNDQIIASTSLIHPWTTLPSIGAVLGLLISTVFWRRRYAVVAFAVLFYFAGHLLESTFLPLELYFEHRNYLPAMFLFWPVGIFLSRNGPYRRIRLTAGVAVPLGLATLTYIGAMIWGDAYRQALIWAEVNPQSPRAQASAAMFDIAHGRYALAIARSRKALALHPNEVQLAAQLVDASCASGSVELADINALLRSIRTAPNGSRVSYNWIDEATQDAVSKRCTGIDTNTVRSAIEAARGNPLIGGRAGPEQDMSHAEGVLLLAEARPDEALKVFNAALALSPNPGLALQQASLLGNAGFPKLGLDHLSYYSELQSNPPRGLNIQSLHFWLLERQGYWKHEEAHLKTILQLDSTHYQNSIEGHP